MNDTTKGASAQENDDWKCEGAIRNVKRVKIGQTKSKEFKGKPQSGSYYKGWSFLEGEKPITKSYTERFLDRWGDE